MNSVKIDDLTFKPFLKEAEILNRIALLAAKVASDYHGKNPVFLCVLNGSFFFSAELLRCFSFEYEISFVRLKSYDGLHSANEIKEFYGLDCNIKKRHVIILEDIVESGLTTHYLINKLHAENPASIAIAALLFKPTQLNYANLPIKYVGFEISNEFVIGFGLDYKGKARNLRNIYQIDGSLEATL